MARTRSAYPCLKPWGQQLTKKGKKENYQHLSLLFHGYKQYQLKGKVSSLKCSLFTQTDRPYRDFCASKSADQQALWSSETSIDGFWGWLHNGRFCRVIYLPFIPVPYAWLWSRSSLKNKLFPFRPGLSRSNISKFHWLKIRWRTFPNNIHCNDYDPKIVQCLVRVLNFQSPRLLIQLLHVEELAF